MSRGMYGKLILSTFHLHFSCLRETHSSLIYPFLKIKIKNWHYSLAQPFPLSGIILVLCIPLMTNHNVCLLIPWNQTSHSLENHIRLTGDVCVNSAFSANVVARELGQNSLPGGCGHQDWPYLRLQAKFSPPAGSYSSNWVWVCPAVF